MPYINITIRNKTNTIRETFSTNAELEVINYIKHINFNRYDMICKHDRKIIKNNIGWLPYHIGRCGFDMKPKIKNVNSYVLVVEEMDLFKQSV